MNEPQLPLEREIGVSLGKPHPVDLMLDGIRREFERKYPFDLSQRTRWAVVHGLVRRQLLTEMSVRGDFIARVLIDDVLPSATAVRPRAVSSMILLMEECEVSIDPSLAEEVARAAAHVAIVGTESILAEVAEEHF